MTAARLTAAHPQGTSPRVAADPQGDVATIARMDLGHLLQRLSDPFNTESRFYWPAVAGVLLAMAAHTLWYLWRPTKPRNPVRDQLETIAYWVDLIALLLVLVGIASKVRASMLVAILAVEWAFLGWLYFVHGRPRFAEFDREERLRRYIPEPKRRAVRR